MENKYLKLAKLVETSNGELKPNSGVAMDSDVDTTRPKDMENEHPPRENGDLSLNKVPAGNIPENKITESLPTGSGGIPEKKVEGELPAKKAEAENTGEIDVELVKIAAALGNKEAIKALTPEEKVASPEETSHPHKETVENIVKLAEAGVVEAQDYISKTEGLMPGLLDTIIQ